MMEFMSQQTRDDQDLDPALVRAAQTGDEAAFAKLVQRFLPVVYSLALRTLANRADAEDAVQEIFLKAYQALARFEPGRAIHPWLYTIALNHLRSLRRRRVFRRRDETLPLVEAVLPAPEALEPEASAMAHETRRLVDAALAGLTPMQRKVFVLRQIQGLSTAETATLLDLPANTVKTHLRRGRRRIADALTAGETSPNPGAYTSMEGRG